MCNIYLSGGMRNLPDNNASLFALHAKKLRAKGHEVFCPPEQNVVDVREAFRRDCEWLCSRADRIAMLPGWEASRGARAEWALANAIDLKIVYLR